MKLASHLGILLKMKIQRLRSQDLLYSPLKSVT